VPAVATVQMLRVAVELLVDETLAGHVEVDAQDVRRAGLVDERLQLLLAGAPVAQVTAQGVVRIDLAAQQVVAEPAPLVLELGLVAQVRRAFDMPEDRKSTRLNSSHVAISYAV